MQVNHEYICHGYICYKYLNSHFLKTEAREKVFIPDVFIKKYTNIWNFQP